MNKRENRPHTLPGGERERKSLARCLKKQLDPPLDHYVIVICACASISATPPYLQKQRGSRKMEAVLAVVLGCVAGMAGLLCLLKLRARGSRLRLPPERTGWIPWLGCALDFGRAPLHFIQKTREAVKIF